MKTKNNILSKIRIRSECWEEKWNRNILQPILLDKAIRLEPIFIFSVLLKFPKKVSFWKKNGKFTSNLFTLDGLKRTKVRFSLNAMFFHVCNSMNRATHSVNLSAGSQSLFPSLSRSHCFRCRATSLRNLWCCHCSQPSKYNNNSSRSNKNNTLYAFRI